MTYIFESGLAHHIEGLIQQKRADGYAYNSEELLSKRTEVAVNDETPSYTPKRRVTSGRSRGRNSRSRGRNSRGRKITIRQGDTLSEIAARNNTTVKKLKRLNKISGNSIRAGKKLRVK